MWKDQFQKMLMNFNESDKCNELKDVIQMLPTNALFNIELLPPLDTDSSPSLKPSLDLWIS